MCSWKKSSRTVIQTRVAARRASGPELILGRSFLIESVRGQDSGTPGPVALVPSRNAVPPLFSSP
ncbi:hypothetical protein RIB2604_02102090 [Aspergillus luchuensis]|uniref:Uncharacterized protein n=1 Tax=Aspergillus kawachii TaxID=1069201 RepID=A0A146FKR6_ASPKA|nr:hypothetical protein RIB2604_02102090 [Aspergillus luchuensis]